MDFFRSINTSASALTAQRLRMDIIADNIANANTTRGADGKPFQRRVPVFAEYIQDAMDGQHLQGVQVVEVRKDNAQPRYVYDPGHPDADARGYVAYPNVNIVREMVDLMEAGRAYEANVTSLNASKEMFRSALSIGKS